MNASKDVLHVMSPCTKSSSIFEKKIVMLFGTAKTR